MENRFCCFLLATLLLSSSQLVLAQELDALGADTQIERRDISEALIDSENFEVTASAGIISIEDFGSNMVTVARLAYHISEDFFAEAAYGISEAGYTSAELLYGDVKILSDDERSYRYYNVSLGYNLLPGEAFISQGRTYNTAFYVIGGAGLTEFAGDEVFTLNYGVGYRLLVNDWLALRVDGRDHVYSSELFGEKKNVHNLEMLFSLSLFF
ncbi:MAG: outer membrane beta-barrel domain-containing protein [Gammaproteobacteria bacterium]|nr:outer membrane beta-barrel domain-containing protein [Gammaproteobacteria bacterium]MCF6229683.1 outer membrane beta-barrel domain-containing protein [Gammaproteobacteria bacterium]